MKYRSIEGLLPVFVRLRILHFETSIDAAVRAFAAGLGSGERLLDAGAGECQHAPIFARQRYVGVDLGVGDAAWDYRRLDALADLAALPFASDTFDGAINIVTLEHVCEPLRALEEIHRALRPGASLLLIVPHEWEVHQSPHDYFRYTRHGVAWLLDQAGFAEWDIQPVGGYFRLLARRLLNGLQFFHGIWLPLAAIFLVPPALLLPSLDWLDKDRNFTLGYICIARKPL